MMRMSKQARDKAARYLRSYGGLADLFVSGKAGSTWKIQFGVWDEERDQITQHAWCYPMGTPRARILSARDIIVRALEGDFHGLAGGEFPEHCAGSVRCPADLARLRWELLTSVHDKNAEEDTRQQDTRHKIGGVA